MTRGSIAEFRHASLLFVPRRRKHYCQGHNVLRILKKNGKLFYFAMVLVIFAK